MRIFNHHLAMAMMAVFAAVHSSNAADLLIHYPFEDSAAGVATNLGTTGNGTLNGTTYSATAAVGSQSLSFDGNADWIRNPNLGSRNAFTMSFWYNTPNNQQCCSNGAVLYTEGGWNNDAIHSSLTNNSSRMWTEFNSGNQRNSGPVTTALNTWNHMVASFENSNITYYVNGVQSPAGSQSMSGPTGRFDVSRIGSWDNSRYYTGLYDDWSIWDNGLNVAESRSLYTLATEQALNYDASNAHDLFDVFAGTNASATIDGKTWELAPDGTFTANEGDVVDLGGGEFGLQLNANGGGVQTVSNSGGGGGGGGVPEPASIAIWTLIGIALGGISYFRYQRSK